MKFSFLTLEADVKAALKVIERVHGSKTGMYFHDLMEFSSGVRVTKSGHGVMSLKIPVKELGSATNDVRAFLPPEMYDNALVPLLVFVDPKQLEVYLSNPGPTV